MTDPAWRAEADDEWAAERRSRFMGWLRRHFRAFGGIAGAVSHADTGPYAGAPRDPSLRLDDEREYSTVRYATGQVTYTTTRSNPAACPRCGQRLVESHEIEYASGDDTVASIGSVRTCRGCEADSWRLRSEMPAASRARDSASKHVV